MTTDIKMAAGSEEKARTLFVFDFDHTLIDDNTDTWVMGVRSGLNCERQQNECWTDFMDRIFMNIHKAGCGREELMLHMAKLKIFDQALRAVKAVERSCLADAIIISDSNTVFIDCILKGCGIEDVFSEVFTNPAHFDSTGRLHVQWYHSHQCRTCSNSPNMCKGTILSDYLGRCCYKKVVYVGDGRGDYCPCLRLRECDTIICRAGYRLAKKLDETDGVRASVHVVDFQQSLGDTVINSCLD